jgi:hypothetical protein
MRQAPELSGLHSTREKRTAVDRGPLNPYTFRTDEACSSASRRSRAEEKGSAAALSPIAFGTRQPAPPIGFSIDLMNHNVGLLP